MLHLLDNIFCLDECLGAGYHNTAHFQVAYSLLCIQLLLSLLQLGNSTEEPASIYHKGVIDVPLIQCSSE